MGQAGGRGGRARALAVVWVALVGLLICPVALAADPGLLGDAPSVWVGDKPLHADIPPLIVDGRLLVPLRPLFEAMGAQVEWHPDLRLVVGRRDDRLIILRLGEPWAVRNGVTVPLDAPPRVVGGRVLVPLRFAAEALGAEVRWDGLLRQARLVMGSPEPAALEGRFAAAVRARAAVARLDIYGPGGQPLGQGSGFLVDKGDRLVTNAHVVAGAERVVALLNGKEYVLERVLTFDKKLDLAVLPVQVPGGAALPLADPSRVAPGQEVVAIGSPLGFEDSVSTGVISAIRRASGQPILHTTAPISPGSSGGPLLNLRGEVVGVNAATIVDGQNLNLAIHVSTLQEVLGRSAQEQPLAQAAADPEAVQAGRPHHPAPGLEAMAGVLKRALGTVEAGGQTIQLDAVDLFDGADGTLLVGFYVDTTNYEHWRTARSAGGDDDLTAWLRRVVAGLATVYGDRPIFGNVFYEDTFPSPPPAFPADEVQKRPSGDYLLSHPLARFHNLQGVPAAEFR